MKKLLLCLSLGLLLLPACSGLSTAQTETTEAINNLTNEAIRIKNNAEMTANQVKEAYDSVNSALGATQEAVEAIHDATASIQAIGGEPESTNDPSLSSED